MTPLPLSSFGRHSQDPNWGDSFVSNVLSTSHFSCSREDLASCKLGAAGELQQLREAVDRLVDPAYTTNQHSIADTLVGQSLLCIERRLDELDDCFQDACSVGNAVAYNTGYFDQVHVIAKSFAKRVDKLANEVVSHNNLGFMSFDLIYQPFEMEIANLCHAFGSSVRRLLNDVSSLVDNARQSFQDFVQTLKLLEGDLLLSSDDECDMLHVFGDTMVHCANILDTVDAVAANAADQFSYDFRVSYCQQVLTIANDMRMILGEVKDSLGLDDFDALSVLCVVCATLDLVVCLQRKSIEEAMVVASISHEPTLEIMSSSIPLTVEMVLQYTRPASMEASSISSDGNCFNHVLTAAYGQVLAFACTIFEGTAAEAFVEDSIDNSFPLNDALATGIAIKDVVESSSPVEFCDSVGSDSKSISDPEMAEPLSIASLLETCVLFDPGGSPTFPTSSMHAIDIQGADECLVISRNPAATSDAEISEICPTLVDFVTSMERNLPTLDKMQWDGDGALMDASQDANVINSKVSPNKTSKTVSVLSNVQHLTSETIHCTKSCPQLCLLDVYFDVNGTSCTDWSSYVCKCLGSPSSTAYELFLSFFLLGYESFPRVKFKTIQAVPSQSTLIFGTDAQASNDSRGSLSLTPTLESNVESKSLTIGSNKTAPKSLAPSLVVSMGCMVPMLYILRHPSSKSHKFYQHVSSLVCTTPTSVDVEVLPHDRGPAFVLFGLFCIYQGFYLFLHDLCNQDINLLCVDCHSYMPIKVDCVNIRPLPYKVANTFGMLECSSMFYTTIMQDDLRFIDYRIPPDKSSATTYLSFLFFKSICNIMYCQIAAYVANMGSLRVSVMTKSLLHTLLSIYKTKSFLQVYGIDYLNLQVPTISI